MDTLGSNIDTSSTDEELRRTQKRRKLAHETQSLGRNDAVLSPNGKTRWRTDAERQIYSAKLLEALRRSRRSSLAYKGREDVQETAYRVLATAARGATRWSRAILASRRRLTRVRKVKKAKVTGESRLAWRRTAEKKRKLPTVEWKLRELSRLIPGCQKAPLSSLLEETSDYIAALEMQVKAMAALAEILGGAVPVNSAQ